MAVLVLRYEVPEGAQVGLAPRLLRAGSPEQPLSTYPSLEYQVDGRRVPCDFKSLLALSKEIHRVLADAVGAMCDQDGQLDHQAVRGHLEELRRLGTELQKRLLPDDVTEELKRQWSIQDIIFECDPRLSSVPFDLMFLWDDFLCFRFGTGKRLLTPALPGPAQDQPVRAGASGTDLPCRGFSLVDPDRLLEIAGARKLRAEFQQFRDSWETLSHGQGRLAREMIDFAKTRAFRAVRKADLEDALRHHPMVNLICHYVDQPSDPSHSGFVLGPPAPDKPSEVFTATDLAACLSPGTLPPWVMLAIACRSGTTEGWEREWLQVDRLYGMVDAAIRAGVCHYVGAIVKVPADRSAGFMFPFYRGLIQGNTIGQSLRAGRQSFRSNPHDPLDAGTALGLAFVLYGDPTVGYFCTEGHLAAGVPQVTCEAMDDHGARCGKLVCRKDASFGKFRCERHGGVGLKCSAGHRVEREEQLTRCRFQGYPCQNSVCPECAGHGQGLCWEHCCHQGHPIAAGRMKRCPDPTGKHPGEERSVCPHDDGWLRQFCHDCLAAAAQGPPACPHCGTFIHEDPQQPDHNPWSQTSCDCCGRPHCAACESWYLDTLYCRFSQHHSQEARDKSWVDKLEERGERDAQLATPAGLRAKLALSKEFQDGLATNVVERTRRRSLLPILRLAFWDVLLPRPRCLGGVVQGAADLSAGLGKALQGRWVLPPSPGGNGPWQVPRAWLDVYAPDAPADASPHQGDPVNQLRVHLVRGLFGRTVIVAVATLTPVAFQRGRGPVLTAGDVTHLSLVKQALSQWWEDQGRKKRRTGALPDTYLVVLSTTGWKPEVCAGYEPGCVTVIAGPEGGHARVTAPPLEGKPEHVKQFVRLLSPRTVYRQQEEILRWIESTLEVDDCVTPAQVQDALEKLWGTAVRDEDVLEALSQLEATGRYKKVSSDLLPLALKKATWPERNRRMLRRRWRGLVGWGVSGASALVAVVSCLLQHPQTARGGLAVAIAVPILNHLLNRLHAFLKQT